MKDKKEERSLARVEQKNNKVDGDLAGGHIFKIMQETKTPLKIMAENYCKEVEADKSHQEFIEELQNFMRRVPGHEQRDLEKKLLAANRDGLVQYATLVKENFTKKLYKHTFSPSAQNIFVHILAKINSCFRLKIKPMISEGKSHRTIDEEIYNEIIETIYNEVGNSELSINMENIHGMLYYLTGNCYIEWDE